MSTVTLKNIRKSYGAVEIIKGVDLQIEDREFCVFVGPSGCGKSTLLRMIAGLEEITSGDLLIDGSRVNDVPPAERGLAMVFQSYALYPHMTVAENMGFALKMIGVGKAEIEAKVRGAAAVLRLEGLLDRRPSQLSGGQRQRVAIGRAITRSPDVFLFDEPLSNLDADLRAQMRIEIARLRDELKTTMIYVTHDQVEAMTLADRIVMLNNGAVEQEGQPLDLYERPANRFVAGFLGQPKMNLLRATAVAAGAGIELRLTADGPAIAMRPKSAGLGSGDAVELGIRPDAFTLTEAGVLSASVVLVERLGGSSLVHTRMDGVSGLITVEVPGTYQGKPQTRIRLGIAADRVHVFGGDGRSL
jgi:multiple sugar transport system ATP-binding protein